MIRIAAMLVALGLVLAGCTPAIDHRGYVVPKRAVEKLASGTATRDEVLQALGSPSSMAALDDRTWYYIGETTWREAFLDPELIERPYPHPALRRWRPAFRDRDEGRKKRPRGGSDQPRDADGRPFDHHPGTDTRQCRALQPAGRGPVGRISPGRGPGPGPCGSRGASGRRPSAGPAGRRSRRRGGRRPACPRRAGPCGCRPAGRGAARRAAIRA